MVRGPARRGEPGPSSVPAFDRQGTLRYDRQVPVVVFLHAFPLNGRMWQAAMTALPAGWRGLAPDYPGFGESPAECFDAAALPNLSLEDHADALCASLAETGEERAVWCGCSMGGYVALAIARRHPDRVAGLVLANTRATADSDVARAGRVALIDAVSRDGVGAAIAPLLPRLLGATTRATRPALLDTVRTLAATATPTGVIHASVRMRQRPDMTDVLRQHTWPVLVIAGAEDELSSLDDARHLEAAAPNGQLVVLPGAGHLACLEQPDTFHQVLGQFLRERWGPVFCAGAWIQR